MGDHPKVTPIDLDRTFSAEEVNTLMDKYEADAKVIFFNMLWGSVFAFGAGIGAGILLSVVFA